MKVLITGTEGYLGSLVAPMLLGRYDVLGVDTGFYKSGWLYHGADRSAETLNKDIRHITREDLQGVDAVVHLAELSNDPVGELAPTITYDINHKASVRLAVLARSAGVRRFVYMSSCSVYGVAEEEEVNETSPVNPQTAYAHCKIMVERDLGRMADEHFSPTFLRNATAFGASPRMRFDIVINNLSGLAWTTREIKLESNGSPWRPFIHALDIGKAILSVLEAPLELVHNQVFNVGDDRHNYQIRSIAEMVAEAFPNCRLTIGDKTGADTRSYRVSFEKIKKTLHFSSDWDAERGIRQLRSVFENVDLSPELFFSRNFTRLKQIKYLLQTNQIDENFFWRDSTDLQFESNPAADLVSAPVEAAL